MREFLLAMPVLLISMVAHEFAHGYAALRQGDDTAYRMGRLTFNPLKHIDPWMTVLLPLMLWYGSGGRFVFGGAKPVPVDPRKYRNYRRGDIIVSSAGVVTNFALAILCVGLSIAIGIIGRATSTETSLGFIQQMAFIGIWLNLLLGFFNLIPIPPLDGSHILYHLLPPRVGARYRALAPYGILILLGLLIFFRGFFFTLLMPAFALYGLAFDLAAPFALQPLPVW